MPYAPACRCAKPRQGDFPPGPQNIENNPIQRRTARCSSVNLARFICPSFVRSDSNSFWRNYSVAGQPSDCSYEFGHEVDTEEKRAADQSTVRNTETAFGRLF